MWVYVLCVCGVVTGPLALQDSHACVCELQLLLWLCVLAHMCFHRVFGSLAKKKRKVFFYVACLLHFEWDGALSMFAPL